MINRVILQGRVTKDPVLAKTPAGVSVINLDIAYNRPSKQAGEKVAEFYTVTAWRQSAEFAAKYCKKGALITVDGRLFVHKYQNRDGQEIKEIRINAENIMVDKYAEKHEGLAPQNDQTGSQQGYQPTYGYQKKQAEPESVDDDEDLPW